MIGFCGNLLLKMEVKKVFFIYGSKTDKPTKADFERSRLLLWETLVIKL